MDITIVIADKTKLCQISIFLGHLAEFVSLECLECLEFSVYENKFSRVITCWKAPLYSLYASP